jgi:hypothetical protein
MRVRAWRRRWRGRAKLRRRWAGGEGAVGEAGGLKRSLGMRPMPWDSKKVAGEGGEGIADWGVPIAD